MCTSLVFLLNPNESINGSECSKYSVGGAQQLRTTSGTKLRILQHLYGNNSFHWQWNLYYNPLYPGFGNGPYCQSTVCWKLRAIVTRYISVLGREFWGGHLSSNICDLRDSYFAHKRWQPNNHRPLKDLIDKVILNSAVCDVSFTPRTPARVPKIVF